MTELFASARSVGHGVCFVFAVVVLGIAAYLGSIFLPDLHPDFTIFAIVVPSLTIIVFMFFMAPSRSTPVIEAVCLFVLAVLWLSMGAWDADIMGNTQCDALGGQQTQTKTGSISSKSYCYEMRVIEAFSWMLFALFAIFLWILITLTLRAQTMGRSLAWYESILDLPWFGQAPEMPDRESEGSPDGSRYGGQGYPFPGMGYPMQQRWGGRQFAPGMGGVGMPMAGGGAFTGPAQAGLGMNGEFVVQQKPGHSVVIQPGAGGGRPFVNQVPVT